MARPITSDTKMPNRYHFPQLSDDGKCVKQVKSDKNRSTVPCGQSRDGDRHLYFKCSKDLDCGFKALSLDARMRHEERDHR